MNAVSLNVAALKEAPTLPGNDCSKAMIHVPYGAFMLLTGALEKGWPDPMGGA